VSIEDFSNSSKTLAADLGFRDKVRLGYFRQHHDTGWISMTEPSRIPSADVAYLAIIMVGLPATGKTHIAKCIYRFLSFFHDIPAQIFNVGDYRRQLCGAQMPSIFYDPTNAAAF
jgi:hypothetical protein